jgi:hypothetical protein
MTRTMGVLHDHCHKTLLGVLARADAAPLKTFAEPLIGEIEAR